MKGWFRSGETLSERVTREAHHGAEPHPTTREPYPQLNSVQQDEAIAWLKGVVKKLDERITKLEKKR